VEQFTNALSLGQVAALRLKPAAEADKIGFRFAEQAKSALLSRPTDPFTVARQALSCRREGIGSKLLSVLRELQDASSSSVPATKQGDDGWD
jgi:hypothetical protein